MWPGMIAAAARLFESAMLLVSRRNRFDERNSAFVLPAKIEATIRTQERSLPKFLLFLPTRFAALEILAGPTFSVRIAIHTIADTDYAAVMVDHYFIGVNFGGSEIARVGADFEKVTAHAVARGDINKAVMINGRGNHGGSAPAGSAPEKLAIICRDASNRLRCKLDVLPDTTNLGNDRR